MTSSLRTHEISHLSTKGGFFVIDQNNLEEVGTVPYVTTVVSDIFRKKEEEKASYENVSMGIARRLVKKALSLGDQEYLLSYLLLLSEKAYVLFHTLFSQDVTHDLQKKKEAFLEKFHKALEPSRPDKETLFSLCLCFCDKSMIPSSEDARKCIFLLLDDLDRLPAEIAFLLIKQACLFPDALDALPQVAQDTIMKCLTKEEVSLEELPNFEKTLFDLFSKITERKKEPFFLALLEKKSFLHLFITSPSFDELFRSFENQGKVMARVLNKLSQPNIPAKINTLFQKMHEDEQHACCQGSPDWARPHLFLIMKTTPSETIESILISSEKEEFHTLLYTNIPEPKMHVLLEEIKKNPLRRVHLLTRLFQEKTLFPERHIPDLLKSCSFQECCILSQDTTSNECSRFFRTFHLPNLAEKPSEEFYTLFSSLSQEDQLLFERSFPDQFIKTLVQVDYSLLEKFGFVTKRLLLEKLRENPPFFSSSSLIKYLYTHLFKHTEEVIRSFSQKELNLILQMFPKENSQERDSLFLLLWKERIQKDVPTSQGPSYDLQEKCKKLSFKDLLILSTSLTSPEKAILFEHIDLSQITNKEELLQKLQGGELITIAQAFQSSEKRNPFLSFLVPSPDQATLPLWKSLLHTTTLPSIKLFLKATMNELPDASRECLLENLSQDELFTLILFFNDTTIHLHKEKLLSHLSLSLVRDLLKQRGISFLQALHCKEALDHPTMKQIVKELIQEKNETALSYLETLLPKELPSFFSNTEMKQWILVATSFKTKKKEDLYQLFLKHIRERFQGTLSFIENLKIVQKLGGDTLIIDLIMTPYPPYSVTHQIQEYLSNCYKTNDFQLTMKDPPSFSIIPHRPEDLIHLVHTLREESSLLDLDLLKAIVLFIRSIPKKSISFSYELQTIIVQKILSSESPLLYTHLIEEMVSETQRELFATHIYSLLQPSLTKDAILTLIQTLKTFKKTALLPSKEAIALLEKVLKTSSDLLATDSLILETLFIKGKETLSSLATKNLNSYMTTLPPLCAFSIFQALERSDHLSWMEQQSACLLVTQICSMSKNESLLQSPSFSTLLKRVPLNDLLETCMNELILTTSSPKRDMKAFVDKAFPLFKAPQKEKFFGILFEERESFQALLTNLLTIDPWFYEQLAQYIKTQLMKPDFKQTLSTLSTLLTLIPQKDLATFIDFFTLDPTLDTKDDEPTKQLFALLKKPKSPVEKMKSFGRALKNIFQ